MAIDGGDAGEPSVEHTGIGFQPIGGGLLAFNLGVDLLHDGAFHWQVELQVGKQLADIRAFGAVARPGQSTDLGIAEAVTFAGPARGSAREQLFTDASLVVLPSPAENFGFVVPEALVRGVPVIATQGAPWSSLVAEACGWWIPPGESALAAALAEALSQPPNALREMGEQGRRLVRAHYTWDRVAASMMELYEWTLGRRDEPAFVQR